MVNGHGCWRSYKQANLFLHHWMSLWEAASNCCKMYWSVELNSCQNLPGQEVILSSSSVYNSDKTAITPLSMLVLAWWPSLAVALSALASKCTDTASLTLVKGIFRLEHLKMDMDNFRLENLSGAAARRGAETKHLTWEDWASQPFGFLLTVTFCLQDYYCTECRWFCGCSSAVPLLY